MGIVTTPWFVTKGSCFIEASFSCTDGTMTCQIFFLAFECFFCNFFCLFTMDVPPPFFFNPRERVKDECEEKFQSTFKQDIAQYLRKYYSHVV